MKQARNIALLAAFGAALIYGLNYTIAKSAMPEPVPPFGFIVLRVAFAVPFFWLLGFFGPKEKIAKSDFLRLLLCAVFGVAVNMLAFFKGLNYTTPINASIIMVTSPIMVLIFSRILLKERLSPLKIFGVFLGLIGTLIVILNGANQLVFGGSQTVLGNFLVYVNASSYALYLVLVKKLIAKYHPFTLAKWLYTVGLFLVLPFGLEEAMRVDYANIDLSIWLSIGYVLLCATGLTYLFNLVALKNLSAANVGVFIYLQPLIAGIFAVMVGADKLNVVKIVAALIIFTGVYLVSQKPKATA